MKTPTWTNATIRPAQMQQPQWNTQANRPQNTQPQQNWQQTQMPQQTPTAPTRPKKVRNFGNGQVIQKGQKVALGGAQSVQVCAGWDVNNPQCDVDISAFMLNDSRKVIGDEWFVFYGETTSPDRSVSLNLNGTNTDDKCVNINLMQINPNVSRIVFVLTINEAFEQRLNFSMVRDAYIRIMNGQQELYRFMLTDYYNTVTSMMLGELYKHNGQWKFSAIGDGVNKDLAGLCAMYGVQTD